MTTDLLADPFEPLNQLSKEVEGPVLLPFEAGYEAEAGMWNLLHEHAPAVVVGATSAADVQAAVSFAAARGLAVAVAATGHGAHAPVDQAVLITTRRMAGVVVDPHRRVARVGAGAEWQAVIEAAAAHGLAPLAGSSPNVGVVGYTLGGGLSPVLGRRYGYAADHVVSLLVVTADGELRHVDAYHEPELFWGLRGGKGNFGVVVELEMRLFPEPEFYGGGLFFDGADATAVLTAWRDLAGAAPDELGTSVALVRMPPVPMGPAPLAGRFVVHVRVAFLGPDEEAERLLAPVRAAGTVLLDTVARMPITQNADVHLDPVDPVAAQEVSGLLLGLPDDALEALVAVAGPDRADYPVAGVELRRLGGALAREPEVPNAVGNRGAAYSLFAIALTEPGRRDPAIDVEFTALRYRLAPWSTGGQVFNFISNALPGQVLASFDPGDVPRLRRLKADVDPQNVFRTGHVIPAAPRPVDPLA